MVKYCLPVNQLRKRYDTYKAHESYEINKACFYMWFRVLRVSDIVCSLVYKQLAITTSASTEVTCTVFPLHFSRCQSFQNDLMAFNVSINAFFNRIVINQVLWRVLKVGVSFPPGLHKVAKVAATRVASEKCYL